MEQREKKANETIQTERENFHKLLIELNKQDDNDLEVSFEILISNDMISKMKLFKI
jgi:hypothetical protein